jgi:hypothetical protein
VLVQARTAFFTMAVGALAKSCAKMLDCTSQQTSISGEAATLDALPEMACWEGDHIPMAALGAVGLLVYCVLAPLKLYHTLKSNAADGQWSNEELEAHAWLLLKVRPPSSRFRYSSAVHRSCQTAVGRCRS